MRVIVGMSGGVDSTIAAYILKKQGHDVIGVYFDFLGKDNSSEFTSLESVSKKLDITIVYKNYAKEFKNTVVKYFVEEYKHGRTPNPCAFCNANMKFKKLYEVMEEYKCDKMATGHYAGIYEKNKRYSIRKSENIQKDQSYMLYALNQNMLSHLIFPIGDMKKDDVRDLAREIELVVADKKDSQDVCFVSNNYAEFIKEYDLGADYKEKIASGKMLPYLEKGEFVDKDEKILAYHDGIINYTIGQRKGLNVAFGERKFVLDIDANKNRVVLGSNDDLMKTRFVMKDVVYQLYDKKNLTRTYAENSVIDKIRHVFKKKYLLCKVRYRHNEEECIIKVDDEKIYCTFKNSVRAITKGQIAVFYENNNIVFGGVIDEV